MEQKAVSRQNKIILSELIVATLLSMLILACSSIQIKKSNETIRVSSNLAGKIYATYLYTEAENSFNEIRQEAMLVTQLGLSIGNRVPLTQDQYQSFEKLKSRIKNIDNKYQKNISQTLIKMSAWYDAVNTSELPVERSYVTSFFNGFSNGMYEVLYSIKSGKNISMETVL